MGLDDANDGTAAGECPGHEFTVEKLVLVRQPGQFIPGIGMEMACTWCGATAYEASQQEL